MKINDSYEHIAIAKDVHRMSENEREEVRKMSVTEILRNENTLT